MNEWSLPENYTSLKVANVPFKIPVPCHTSQDNWNQDKNTNNMAMNNRTNEGQKSPNGSDDFLSDEFGITSSVFKKKKPGASDPRFKKIIDTESRHAPNSEPGKLGQKTKTSSMTNQAYKDRILNERVLSYLKSPNGCSMFMSPTIKCLVDQKERELSAEVTKDTNFQVVDNCAPNNDNEFSYSDIQKNIKDESLYVARKLKSCYKTDLKRSASDCTLQMKNPLNSLKANESTENIRSHPSVTKLSNADSWIKQEKVLPEKRRSVVTVIGQTQTKPLSQILNEIHQRRKLAKELDKHALCEALLNSMESHSEFKNVVAKVDLVLPDGKVIYSTEKVYTRRDYKLGDTLYGQNSVDVLDSDSKRKKLLPERDSSTSQMGKKKVRRTTKKSVSAANTKIKLKDNLKTIFDDASPRTLWFLLAIFCLVLCYGVLFFAVKTPQPFYLIKIFKPKTTAWYEKLLFL